MSRIASSITFHSVFPLLHPPYSVFPLLHLPYMEDRKHRGSFFRPLSGIVCRCLFVCKSGNCLYRLAGCYPAWCPARHLRCRSLATHCPVLTSSASEDYVPDKKHKLRLLRSFRRVLSDPLSSLSCARVVRLAFLFPSSISFSFAHFLFLRPLPPNLIRVLNIVHCVGCHPTKGY